MTREEFEPILEVAAAQLGEEVRATAAYRSPDAFQQRVFDVLTTVARGRSININPTFHPHAFPGYGMNARNSIRFARRNRRSPELPRHPAWW